MLTLCPLPQSPTRPGCPRRRSNGLRHPNGAPLAHAACSPRSRLACPPRQAQTRTQPRHPQRPTRHARASRPHRRFPSHHRRFHCPPAHRAATSLEHSRTARRTTLPCLSDKEGAAVAVRAGPRPEERRRSSSAQRRWRRRAGKENPRSGKGTCSGWSSGRCARRRSARSRRVGYHATARPRARA